MQLEKTPLLMQFQEKLPFLRGLSDNTFLVRMSAGKHISGVSAMTHWVTAFAAKLDGLNFMTPGYTWWKERTNSHELFCDHCAHVYTQTINSCFNVSIKR